MKLKDKIRSTPFIDTFGSGELSPQELLSIFRTTSEKLLIEESKYGHLLYPLKPREVEARQVMGEVLNDSQLNYMIECPIYSPVQKIMNRTSFVDLSIFLDKGIVDIEFKQSPSDIDRDFPKLLSPSSIGCASFYLFNEKSIDNQINLIKNRFQAAYDNTLYLNGEFAFFEKWYLIYIVALEERRTFYKIYNNLRNLQFSDIVEHT
jgi:hypothetical protein